MYAAISTRKNLEMLRDIVKQNGMDTLYEPCKRPVRKGTKSIF
jgi:hypothetical protein